ncbi:hypothetical protein CEQ21_05800 [Niallia circulans]|uniref:Uncharacterized protein n=1 Tax=Niallia circulans TaxID=1397 RepID=A0A553STW0_NIACI|nr:hypothetical protein [Niallia circulans]TRZ40425.1 hypothetical protein CEQ21_05800 [Niallia circulans]
MVKKKLYIVLTALALLIMTGCSAKGEEVTAVSGEIDAEEVLSLNPEADIFQFEGVIYQTNIDWVDELALTKDAQVGEIKTLNEANTDFNDEMANKLKVGSKIFSAKERNDILIVENESGLFNYLAIVEG